MKVFWLGYPLHPILTTTRDFKPQLSDDPFLSVLALMEGLRKLRIEARPSSTWSFNKHDLEEMSLEPVEKLKCNRLEVFDFVILFSDGNFVRSELGSRRC